MYHSHPGQIVNDVKQVRRSKAEVDVEKAVKARTKQAAAAKVKEIEEQWEVGIKCVAAIEDEMQKQITNACQNAMHPDQVNQDIHQKHLLMQQNETRNLLTHVASYADDASYDKMELETDVATDTYDPADFP